MRCSSFLPSNHFANPSRLCFFPLDAGSRISFFLRYSRTISLPSRLSTMHVFLAPLAPPIPSHLFRPIHHHHHHHCSIHITCNHPPSHPVLRLYYCGFVPYSVCTCSSHPVPMPRTHARSSWNFSGPPPRIELNRIEPNPKLCICSLPPPLFRGRAIVYPTPFLSYHRFHLLGYAIHPSIHVP